jgi:starch-binding outer membrane protein, SusD/RagB family
MNSFDRRVRAAFAAGAAGLGLLALGACNPKQELLAPQQPGVILPTDVQSPTAAEGLYNGAVGQFGRGLIGGNGNQETIWQFVGLFTDEFRSSDTFSQRNDADQRITQTGDGVLSPLYITLQQIRGSSRTALTALTQFEPTTSSTHQAELYFTIAFAEMQLGEDFCNGIPLGQTVGGLPVYTAPLATKDVFSVALARVDSGLALATGTDAGTLQVKNALLITKGRLQLDLGQFAAAATTVAAVPVAFQYNADFAQSTADNGWWIMTTSSKRYSVGDSVDATGTIKNAIPFVSAKDPRVPTTRNANGFDSTTPLFLQNIWNRDDPVAIVDGLDGQLIQAEAKLNTGDFAGMTAILNALRAAPPTQGIFKPAGTLAPLVVPATMDAATTLFFREKAFWTFGRGQRLDDLRRQVRQYGRTADQVYEQGNYFKNGTYGALMFFPVPDSERSNPLFTGCIDQNP